MDLARKLQGRLSRYSSCFKITGDVLQYLLPVSYFLSTLIFVDFLSAAYFAAFYVLAFLIVLGGKCLFDAPRPFEVDGKSNPKLTFSWSPTEGNSFPSGHTMSAMMGGIFFFNFGTVFGLIGVCFGLLTAVSRMVVNMHWARDTIFSLTVSTFLFWLSL